MSGSPVYIDGKLVGAVSLRLSTFSPDAICGITPIQLMLEVKDLDKYRPSDSKTPDKTMVKQRKPGGTVGAAAKRDERGAEDAGERNAHHAPRSPPLSPCRALVTRPSACFHPFLINWGSRFRRAAQAGSLETTKPAADWRTALQPGEAVDAVLVSGDMTVSGGGTVTYQRWQAHSGFRASHVQPWQRGYAPREGAGLWTLASSYQPTKIGTPTEVVGAVRQDRHSAIEGELGATAQMIPV